jgi:protein-disulfide isomerase
VIRTAILVVCASLICIHLAQAEACQPLSDSEKTRIVEYLGRHIISTAGITRLPTILSSSDLPSTCYKRLEIRVAGTATPLILFLSPDHLYLTSKLYDLSTPAEFEERTTAANRQLKLLKDLSPAIAEDAVPVVEFTDFQCPYCRQFMKWYRDLPLELQAHSSLVLRHWPLAQHSWAKTASLYTACAALQSQQAFWALVEYIFSRQDEITPQNIEPTIATTLTQRRDINRVELNACLTDGRGEAVVKSDLALGGTLEVHGTPTVFIGGRLASIRSSEDLDAAIRQELQRSSGSKMSHQASAQ